MTQDADSEAMRVARGLTDEQLSALQKMRAEASPGDWYVEGDEAEGGWGRYLSYSLRSDKLSRDYDILADATNATAAEIHDEWDEDGGHRWDEVSRRNFHWIAAIHNGFPALATRLGVAEQERHDLAMLLRIIIHRHGKGFPLDEKLAAAADYLTRKNLNGSVLRDEHGALGLSVAEAARKMEQRDE